MSKTGLFLLKIWWLAHQTCDIVVRVQVSAWALIDQLVTSLGLMFTR
jgi:hypothetical protein